MFLIFLEDVKIISVGLNFERPQLQHWLLFLEHNRLRSNDLSVVAGLPVPMDYDCIYPGVFMIQSETLPVLLILSNAGSSSSSCRI